MRLELKSLALVAAVGLAMAVAAPPVVANGRPACLVANARTGVGLRSLQQAVDAARAGDTLVVKGTCTGSTTITKSLKLRGQSNNAYGPATLDGAGAARVLSVDFWDAPSATMAIDGLTITHGNAANDGAGGGGLWIQGGTTTIGNSRIVGNSSGLQGGGIELDVGSLTLVNSQVTDNSLDIPAPYGGSGAGILSAGSLTLVNALVSGNSGAISGGGIWNVGSGALALVDSVVTGNSAVQGGGIANEFGAAVSVVRSTISANHATNMGGGIFNGPAQGSQPASSLTITGSRILGNTATWAAGISNYGSLGFSGAISTIGGNTASSTPGGLFNYAGVGQTTHGCPTALGGLVDYSPANSPSDYIGLVCGA